MTRHNFDFAISADISEKVIKEMITQVLEEQTGRKVAEVKLKVELSYDDRQMGSSYPIFKGATVIFDNATAIGDRKW
jgi:hypothetical protein